MAGKSSPIFKLARAEQRLVVAGELERITGLLGRRSLPFRAAGTVPGKELDNRRSS